LTWSKKPTERRKRLSRLNREKTRKKNNNNLRKMERKLIN
jgi:hypothetical protein